LRLGTRSCTFWLDARSKVIFKLKPYLQFGLAHSSSTFTLRVGVTLQRDEAIKVRLWRMCSNGLVYEALGI